MRIYIKEEKDNKVRKICIPRCFCSLGTKILTRVSINKLNDEKKQNISGKNNKITKDQAKVIKKMVKVMNKKYAGLVLVDIDTPDEKIKIII